jgi:outer membrane protein assembly factor BamB
MIVKLRIFLAAMSLFLAVTAQSSRAGAVPASSPSDSRGSNLNDGSGNVTAPVLIARAASPDEDLPAFGMLNGESDQIDLGVGINWPMFKNQTSRLSSNPFETIINSGNADRLGLSWVGIMGDLVDFSSPAVVNGVVYIASLDGNLYAFNANGCGQSSCNPLWVGTMNSNFSSLSSPAVVNGMVYVGSEDHKLYVFAAAGCGHNTCPPLWTGSTGGSVFSSPLVAGNVVYIGSEDHRFYAFPANGCGRSTCTPLWTGNTGGAIDSSPALGNGVVYVGSQDGKLYTFNAKGCGGPFCRPLWTAQVGQTIFGSSPAVSNGQVYIASFSEPNSSDSKLYSFNANGCGGPTCQPLWTAAAGDFVTSSPAVANGRVYIGSGDDLLYAFDANGCHQPTCTALWRGEAIGAQAGLVSTPAVANGVVYVGENNGMVEVFDANGCGDSICLPLTQLLTNNEPIVSSSPAVVNGTVYFGSADQGSSPIGRLYVFKLAR